VELSRSLRDPSGKTLYESWNKSRRRALQNQKKKAEVTDGTLVNTRVGSGSDHTVFLNFLRRPVITLGFTGPHGVYHSMYDNFYWMNHFGDPGYRYHKLLAQFWSAFALRLANADILPLDFEFYGHVIGQFAEEIGQRKEVADQLNLGELFQRVTEFRVVGSGLKQEIAQALASNQLDLEIAERVNHLLMEVESNWLIPEGLPGRPWFKHAFFGTRFTYAHLELPALTEAVERGNWEGAQEQVENLENALARNTALLAKARATLEKPAQRQQTSQLKGFSIQSTSWQREFETRLKKLLSEQKVREHLRWLTSRPHRAGTEGARITAAYLHDRLQEYGFETETIRYDAYLPEPVSVFIELIEPRQEILPTTEELIPGDPFTAQVENHPGWNGYSPTGEATGEVVYAHYGSEEDLVRLEAIGVDLRGKILLMRYFGVGEGRKVHNAERHGAAGVVLFADPAEDGYPYGDVYPRGNWRPPGSIMRRSIEFLPYSGDPLTPGWASVTEARRLSPAEVPLPRIPVLPISYRSAELILRELEGPVAPWQWQGGLGLTYKVGSGPAKLHIRTEMDNRVRPMWNVIGRLKGAVYPNEWVILGNDHDAWIFGAGDPSSGTASLLDLARVLGELGREGYRPRRTLLVAFWDAEEMILGGSTEWVEDNAETLLEKAVAYINMDSSVFNPERPLRVAAHTGLHALFRDVSRDIRDPNSGHSLFEAWRELQNEYRSVPSVDGWGEFLDRTTELSEPWIFEVPSDDASPFYHQLALPASDMYYGGDYGMYHSAYENFHWMETVVDPTFRYHILMAQMQGLVGLRLANADLLPLDFVNEARFWKLAYGDLKAVFTRRGYQLAELDQAVELIARWQEEAEALAREAEELLNDEEKVKKASSQLPRINKLIYQAARNFLRREGRRSASTERNLFAGSSHDFEGVSGGTLPGIRFALDKGKWDEAVTEARIYRKALEQRINTLKTIRTRIRERFSEYVVP
jgi:N-acetylated-alpha-linked acidic dipeptidase